MTDIAQDDHLGGARRGAAKPAPSPGKRVAADRPTIEAVGKASEALECIERARGHLYSFHQLIGHADLQFGEAVELLRQAGHAVEADRIDVDVIGRNVLDGRWTFQVVEEFDDLYYRCVVGAIRELEHRLMDGHRHVYESMVKEERRTTGRSGHESRPPSAHSSEVVTEQ